jgi:hypothetical protein
MIIDYIKNQQEHHKKVSFKEEYRKLLEENGIKIDERYFRSIQLLQSCSAHIFNDHGFHPRLFKYDPFRVRSYICSISTGFTRGYSNMTLSGSEAIPAHIHGFHPRLFKYDPFRVRSYTCSIATGFTRGYSDVTLSGSGVPSLLYPWV